MDSPPPELDWAGRGTSHVDFARDEKPPLEEGRFLGHGVNGGVYETTCQGTVLAWKRRFCRTKIGDEEKKEIEILKKLSHRHIVRLVGTYTHRQFLGLLLWPVALCDWATLFEDIAMFGRRSRETNHPTSEDENYESARTRAYEITRRDMRDNVPDGELPAVVLRALIFFRLISSLTCICKALEYLHDQRIRHKDIKPSNILISNDGVWLTDFGSSTDFSELSTSRTENGGGTEKYKAPEVANCEPSGRPADIFSLGCVLLELCWLYSEDGPVFWRERRAGSGSFHANLGVIHEWFKTSATDLDNGVLGHVLMEIRRMLDYSPEDRPAAAILADHFSLISYMQNDSGRRNFFPDYCCASFRPVSSLADT
ncbi:kinase-like domain-containing protein [Lineolata rhizophorae]|uniref:non-specific serine/threonine protein kinase n=1 Tax=Lineolata rhizophorae TaxID=578093 RepID=A0A6A6NKV7_9PEZI|nr:kinase-like domain-containing protein [Lineolata rhizophorae]